MTGIVSFELLLDERTEFGVRAEWEALAAAGLSSLAAHPSASNRPHVTMLVRPAVPTPARPALEEAVRLPLRLVLGPLILFGVGERRVVARSVLASRELLRAHADLHRLAGPGEDAPHTRPGDWTPHITLARRLRIDDLPRALRLFDEVRASVEPDRPDRAEPPEASAVALRRWDSATATITDVLGRG
ncbi:2'-5' RNA ligase family protein [Herbiconiux sp.]|uniref:2'-5' RNA ligase family protein n=1 Tax=Herbiconiux sp. TaxID=1871186 RepID=UPI0025BF532D|nr:2'-5' RNA ligase family protein [Herbiconiux sp.]